MDRIEKAFEAEGIVDPDYAGRELSERDVARGRHRRWVGRHWDEQGERQLDFLKSRGLEPHHRLIDIGCGSFRAGRHFVDYLEPGNYYGLDANHSVMQAGYEHELTDEQRQRLPVANLRASDRFGVDFGVPFDFAIAQSVFTHISLNMIRLCLYRTSKVMTEGGRFYATVFVAPKRRPLDEIHRTERGKPKFQDRNCFWYYRSDIEWAARAGEWRTDYIGDWGHPANQKMFEFTKLGEDEARAAEKRESKRGRGPLDRLRRLVSR